MFNTIYLKPTHLSIVDRHLWRCSLIYAIQQYLYPHYRSTFLAHMHQPYASDLFIHTQDKATPAEDSYEYIEDSYYNSELTYTCCDDYTSNTNSNNNNDDDNYGSFYDDTNKDTEVHALVINLSPTHLNSDAIAILSKGLKFCPTPGEPDLSTAQSDLDTFHLRMKRYLHFHSPKEDIRNIGSSPNDGAPPTPGPFKSQEFKNPSSWVPPPCIPLEIFIAQNNQDLFRSKINAPRRQNITKEQRQAIRELYSNPNIVIKPADKGGATVIWDRSDYIKEGMRQLSDANFYNHTDTDLSKQHYEQIKLKIDDMVEKNEIDESCASFLSNPKYRTSNFYMLPKIHKKLDNPPGRPIVSGNGCPTERISQFVDHFLKPIVQNTTSYIRDTTHFLKILQDFDQTPDNTFLVTLDVSSLYTNIPNDLGIAACKEQLEINQAGSKFPTNSSIIELLDMVLTKNNFCFNGLHFLQVGGTAMGTRLAPSYANLFMDYFERHHVYTYHTQPLLWKRYIDDIFMLWDKGVNELQNFIEHLNNCLPSIKFESHISDSEISFLDVKVQQKNNVISTSLFTKETDTLSYLDYSSCHPVSCKKSIPYSQFLRLRRICSDEDDFVTQSKKLAFSFHRANYPDNVIQTGFDKAFAMDRDTLLNKQSNNSRSKNKNDPKLYLITDYHPSFRAVLDIVSDNWDVLDNSSSTRPILHVPVIRGFRRPKNLRDLLVRAKLTTPDTSTKTGARKKRNLCTRMNCIYCKLLDRTGRITCPYNKRSYISRFNVNCNSNNLIYCLVCRSCNKIYVGQTKRSIRERAGEHLTSIRKKKRHLVVGRHYNTPGHKGVSDIKIYVLEFVRAAPNATFSKTQREMVEAKWIFRLRSTVPIGLNLLD